MWGDCSIYLNGKSLWLTFVSRWSVHLFLLQWYKCTSCALGQVFYRFSHTSLVEYPSGSRGAEIPWIISESNNVLGFPLLRFWHSSFPSLHFHICNVFEPSFDLVSCLTQRRTLYKKFQICQILKAKKRTEKKLTKWKYCKIILFITVVFAWLGKEDEPRIGNIIWSLQHQRETSGFYSFIESWWSVFSCEFFGISMGLRGLSGSDNV